MLGRNFLNRSAFLMLLLFPMFPMFPVFFIPIDACVSWLFFFVTILVFIKNDMSIQRNTGNTGNNGNK